MKKALPEECLRLSREGESHQQKLGVFTNESDGRTLPRFQLQVGRRVESLEPFAVGLQEEEAKVLHLPASPPDIAEGVARWE